MNQAVGAGSGWSPSETVALYIRRLHALDRGELAPLGRCAGRTLAESRDAMGSFYRLLPYAAAGGRDEEVYFLIATLFGLDQRPFEGNFGKTMRAVKAKSGSASVDRRMDLLLDSEFDLIEDFKPGGGELAYRLRQCVRLAAGREVGVDWARLLTDLLWWAHPDKRARKQWARSYYAGEEDPSTAAQPRGEREPC